MHIIFFKALVWTDY